MYVYTAVGFDDEIRELDYATGWQLSTWRLPQARTHANEFDFAPTFVDGGQVLQVNGNAYSREKSLAALLNIGRS